jgi:hypothetical protein
LSSIRSPPSPPRSKLVESNVPTTLNTSAGAGRLKATPRLVIAGMDLPGHGARPGQGPPPATGCDAWRPRPQRGGASGCGVADGRAGGCGNLRRRARRCMRCNESGWLPGQTRDVAEDAEAWRVPSSCGAGRAPLTGTADDTPGATGCSRMHRDASRRNYDARRATESAASSLHQIQADHEVPGHRSCAALPADRGTATPHAAPQAARVHAKCRMMHQMQFCPFSRYG